MAKKRSRSYETSERPHKKSSSSHGLTKEDESKMNKLMQVKHKYKCPITHDILRDPVYIQSSTAEHIMYERNSVELWLSRHKTDPFTGTVLADAKLQSNQYFIKALSDYREKVIRQIIELVQEIQAKSRSQALTLLDHALSLVDEKGIDSKIKILNTKQKLLTCREEQIENCIALLGVCGKRNSEKDIQEIVSVVKSVLFNKDMMKVAKDEQLIQVFSNVWNPKVFPLLPFYRIADSFERAIQLYKNNSRPADIAAFLSCIMGGRTVSTRTLISAAAIAVSGDHVQTLLNIIQNCKSTAYSSKNIWDLDERILLSLDQVSRNDCIGKAAEVGMKYYKWRVQYFPNDFSMHLQLLLLKLVEWNPNDKVVSDLCLSRDTSAFDSKTFMKNIVHQIAELSKNQRESERKYQLLQYVSETKIVLDSSFSIEVSDGTVEFMFAGESWEIIVEDDRALNQVSVSLELAFFEKDEDYAEEEKQLTVDFSISLGSRIHISEENVIFTQSKSGYHSTHSIQYWELIDSNYPNFIDAHVIMELKDKQ